MTSTPVADYNYAYTITGNVQTQNIALAAMSKDVTLAADYDYNNNMTTLAANINTGGGTATFNSDGTISFSGGADDFENKYSYDTLGDMTGIQQVENPNSDDGASHNDVQAKNVAMSYDADQRLAGVDMYQSSGTSDLVSSSALSYDADSDLTDLVYYTNTAHTGTPMAGYHWDYNSAGVVTDEHSRNDSSAATPDTSYTGTGSDWAKTAYTYDPTAQLTAATYTSFASSPTPPSDYSADYDPNGNRTSATGADGTSTGSTSEASFSNRLLFDGTYYLIYDAAGNRTAKFKSDSGVLDSSATDITIYTWNNANELTSATHYNTYYDWQHNIYTAASEYAITYGNDAFGRMVTRAAAIGNGTSAPSATENFIYNGQNIALVLDADGNVIERELTGTAADQVFATESVVSGVGTVNWLLTDNQGTVRDVVQFDSGTDTTNEVDHLVYGAFGQLVSQSEPSDAPTFYYNGTWQDPQTGLNKMGLRWYAAVDAVWASYDPDDLKAGPNPFEFCDDSPTNLTDPSGMQPPPAHLSAGTQFANFGGKPLGYDADYEFRFFDHRSPWYVPSPAAAKYVVDNKMGPWPSLNDKPTWRDVTDKDRDAMWKLDRDRYNFIQSQEAMFAAVGTTQNSVPGTPSVTVPVREAHFAAAAPVGWGERAWYIVHIPFAKLGQAVTSPFRLLPGTEGFFQTRDSALDAELFRAGVNKWGPTDKALNLTAGLGAIYIFSYWGNQLAPAASTPSDPAPIYNEGAAINSWEGEGGALATGSQGPSGGIGPDHVLYGMPGFPGGPPLPDYPGVQWWSPGDMWPNNWPLSKNPPFDLPPNPN